MIRYYFECGFEYNEILQFLTEKHQHAISKSTLLRILKEFGLQKHNCCTDQHSFQIVRDRVKELLHGSVLSGAYRTILHSLQLEGSYACAFLFKLLQFFCLPEKIKFCLFSW